MLKGLEWQEQVDEAARCWDSNYQEQEEDLGLLDSETKNGNKAKKMDGGKNFRVRKNHMWRPEWDVYRIKG